MEYFSKGPKLKKGRSGSMPKNVSTVLNGNGDDTAKIPGSKKKLSSIQFQAFADEMRKIAAGAYSPNAAANQSTGASGVPPASVTDDEALEAASILDKQKRRPLVGHLQYGAAGGAIAPFTAAAGRAAKGFVDTKGGLRKRLGGAAQGVMSATAGDVAQQAVAGGMTGAALSKLRAEMTESAAEKRVNQFLKERGG